MDTMKITKLTLGRSFKVSKNYNSQDASMSIDIEVGENDNLEEIISQGYNFLSEKCKEQLKFKD